MEKPVKILFGISMILVSFLFLIAFMWISIGVVNYFTSGPGAEPETYIFPENFIGEVNIIYNQEGGQKETAFGGRRVYRIPDEGIVFSGFERNKGRTGRKDFLRFEAEGSVNLKPVFMSKSLNHRRYLHDKKTGEFRFDPNQLAIFEFSNVGRKKKLILEGDTTFAIISTFFVDSVKNFYKYEEKDFLIIPEAENNKRD